MIQLNFEHPEQFKGLFGTKSRKVTDGIVLGIREAMENNQSSADLFEISFEDYNMSYEISLPKKQWSIALQSCLDFYHQVDATDECIDTWKLLEAAKVW
jgi:hypothetical protein